ncbi:MAG: PcfJ domain-containing protein, partial [Romboutsia sp.]|nr:PcfJ domain-containing protein [Romboutsia sp.]
TDIIKDDLINSIYNNYKNKFNFKINTLDEFCEEAMSKSIGFNAYSLNILQIYQCNPTFNPYILTLMVKNGLGLNEYSDLNEGVYKYDFLNNIDEYSTDVLKYVFDYFGIPYVKSLRKYILSNPECFVALAYNSLIFKDVNMLKNILVPDKVKWLPIPYYFLESVVKVLKVDNNIDNLDSELDEFHRINKLKFLNHLVKTQGEEIAGNKLVNFYKVFEWENRLTDTANMFSTYTEIYGREYDDLTGSILQIHDRLVRFTGGNTPLKKVDFKLYKYSKEQLELEYEHNGYIFKLPKTGLEVATIGAELHNCVGTYRDKVRKNQCLIVLVEKDSKPKVCIEIFKGKVSEEYEIKQAKLDCNNPVYNDKEAFDAVMFWMKKNNIQSSHCYDLISRNKRRVNVEQEIQDLGAFEGELAIANDDIPF